MDIFKYRDDLLGDYASYVKGFLEVQDADLETFISTRLDGGVLWPEPLVQLNPAFLPGPTIDELVDQGKLDPTCKKIFRRGKTLENTEGSELRLHRHQATALECAQQGANYVLTTGTGSGKSLTYILPIVDHVLKSGSGNGIQAIVVYPMNALANSQLGEMEKFLGPGFPSGKPPVRFARYTGQEKDDVREEILQNPPDVLLTNYVMLELILTRPRERDHLIKAAEGLKYLVLDELHTYRGRQGADVAMLVRRLRETLKAKDLLFVGTSATMGSGATIAEIKTDVAAVASRLFGSKVEAGHVIGESLRRITAPISTSEPSSLEALRIRVQDPSFEVPTSFNAFCADPLAGWIETTFGLEEEPETRNLRRTTPKTLAQAGTELGKLIGLETTICSAAIQRWLLSGYKCEPDPFSGNRPFAFRLHQFVSKGDCWPRQSVQTARRSHGPCSPSTPSVPNRSMQNWRPRRRPSVPGLTSRLLSKMPFRAWVLGSALNGRVSGSTSRNAPRPFETPCPWMRTRFWSASKRLRLKRGCCSPAFIPFAKALPAMC